MKSLLLFWILVIGSIGFANAQSFDDMMVRNRYVNCQDVSYNAAGMIRKLYQQNQLDSIYSFLNYWQSKCGKIEQIYRLRLLLDIKTANFDRESVNNEMFSYMIRYKPETYQSYAAPIFFERFNLDEYEIDYQQALKNVDAEIDIIAKSIDQTYSTDEALLKEFYTASFATFDEVKKASPQESGLKRIYDRRLEDALKLPEFHWALFLGYYQPFNKLEVFGAHPTVGLMGGMRKARHNFDMVMDVRIGPSKNEYEFVYKGQLTKDDKWTGIYFGLEYTYDFLSRDKLKIGLSPGIAYNGITAVTADDDDDDAKILPSYDINGGLVAKFPFGRSAYAGLHLRYHWVDHRNTGGTELNGNYLSARLVIGSIFNYDRSYKLSQLDYR